MQSSSVSQLNPHFVLQPIQYLVRTEYLFKKDPETDKARLDQVMADAKRQLKANPGCQLFITGHSLGGALSTLFGFYAAIDDEIVDLSSGPVVVYSIASPFVGNWKFRMAFQELERRKRLQHLRIANFEDMVTLLPFAAPKATALSPALSLFKGAGNLYKHCGVRLQLTAEPRDGKTMSFFYPRDKANDEEYGREVRDAVDAGKSLMTAFYHLVRRDFDTILKHHRYAILCWLISCVLSPRVANTYSLPILYAPSKLHPTYQLQ